MKSLTLLRHAKSDWTDTVLIDFERPLNRRGEHAATLMGSWARQQGLEFDGILASPAERTRQTVDRFVASHGACPAPGWDKRLYLASDESIAEIVGEVDDRLSSLLIVGHNPGLEQFILRHAPADQAPAQHRSIVEKFPTASLATLEFAIDHWTDIAQGRGAAILRRFVRPRDLDATLGPDKS